MIGVNNPWAIPESQLPEGGLGFSLRRQLDPRTHLRRLKKMSDPRSHLKMLRKGIDPRTGLKLVPGRRRRRRKGGMFGGLLRKMTPAQKQAFLAARQGRRRSVIQGSIPAPITMAVSSPEATAALSDLGFKLKIPKIGRKLRKKIVKYAAIGAAAYFTGGAALTALRAKPGLLGGALKKVAGGVKAVAPIAKTVIQAKMVPTSPDSVYAYAGGSGIPTGGAPGSELFPTYGQVPGGAFGGGYSGSAAFGGGGYTPLPQQFDPETGEVTTGISARAGGDVQQAGFGGLPPALILGGLAVGAFMLLGGRGRR